MLNYRIDFSSDIIKIETLFMIEFHFISKIHFVKIEQDILIKKLFY